MECVEEQSSEVGLGDEDAIRSNPDVETTLSTSRTSDTEVRSYENEDTDMAADNDRPISEEEVTDSNRPTKMLLDNDSNCGSEIPQENDNEIEHDKSNTGTSRTTDELIDEHDLSTEFDNGQIQDEVMNSTDVVSEIEENKMVQEDVLMEEIMENSSVETNKYKKSKNKQSTSAFERLASLGVIVEQKSSVESEENALKKLVSRGVVSITAASGASLPHSIGSAVSITPTKNIPKATPSKSNAPHVTKTALTPHIGTTIKSVGLSAISSSKSTTPDSTKSKYKPGPKSAKAKQNAKKLKLDPGNSEDIEKDFDSIINLLSTGGPEDKNCNNPATVQESAKNKSETNMEVSDDKLGAKTDNKDDLNDSFIGQGTNLSHTSEVNEDQSANGTDNESHDESKSVSHSPDCAEDVDDKVPSTSKVRNAIEEGSAEILLSPSKHVFYNKVQEFNRDMSIAALTVFSEMHQQDPRTRNRGRKRKTLESETDTNGPTEEENVFQAGRKSDNGITILEALSATGLRSIRYAKEIPGVKQVYANDMSEDAVETIEKNIQHNKVEDLVSTSMSDASLLMYQRQAAQEWYDAIDLDPYGCPSRFLNSAVQAVRDGGLLLVTCTDMAILAGNTPETCHVKYGAVSLRTPSCHEMALRIALQCIESYANRYGRYIVPLLSFSADFYIRLIVQVYTSPVTCKKTTSKLSMVYQCVGCQTHTLQPLGLAVQEGQNTQPKFSLCHGPPVDRNCYHCNHKHHVGGPIWSAPLYSTKFLDSMLRVTESGYFNTAKRMQGMLEVIREELLDVPLYYTIAGLCSKLHCQNIPLIDIRSAILNAGYRVSSSHASPTALKTNAPSKVIWDIMRCWVHMNPVSQKRLVPGSVSAAIIIEPPQLIANFDIHAKAKPSSSMRKLLRYQPNPEKNWGPGMRARCSNDADDKDEKRKANQNKKSKKGIDIIEVVTIEDDDSPQKTTDTSSACSTMT